MNKGSKPLLSSVLQLGDFFFQSRGAGVSVTLTQARPAPDESLLHLCFHVTCACHRLDAATGGRVGWRKAPGYAEAPVPLPPWEQGSCTQWLLSFWQGMESAISGIISSTNLHVCIKRLIALHLHTHTLASPGSKNSAIEEPHFYSNVICCQSSESPFPEAKCTFPFRESVTVCSTTVMAAGWLLVWKPLTILLSLHYCRLVGDSMFSKGGFNERWVALMLPSTLWVKAVLGSHPFFICGSI